MSYTPKILAVDDEEINLQLVKVMLDQMGYNCITATNGAEAKEEIRKDIPDLVITDVMMPKVDGYQLCSWIKNRKDTRLLPVIMITGLDSLDSRVAGIEAGADDFITKPFEHVALRARVSSLLKLKEYTDELENAEEVIFSLALAVEAKDPYTRGHCQRLSDHGVSIGEMLDLDPASINAIRRGGILHDIGKIGIPDHILLKPGPLTSLEREVMREHPTKGEGICKPLQSLELTLPIIRHHHERVDGSGYPDGLKGNDIPIGARIIAAVDFFDALVTDRPYRQALPFDHSLHILKEAVEDGHLDGMIFDSLNKFVNQIGADWINNDNS